MKGEEKVGAGRREEEKHKIRTKYDKLQHARSKSYWKRNNYLSTLQSVLKSKILADSG